jgi:hypothetical protein
VNESTCKCPFVTTNRKDQQASSLVFIIGGGRKIQERNCDMCSDLQLNDNHWYRCASLWEILSEYSQLI